MLTDTYVDMCVIALVGINEKIDEFKPIGLYRTLREMPLFEKPDGDDPMELLIVANESEDEKDEDDLNDYNDEEDKADNDSGEVL